MRKSKILYAILVILIVLALLLIPASLAGSSQIVQAPSETATTTDEAALNKPPVQDQRASNITKTIALLETSGTLDCSRTGLSGEKGCHQFLPSTWRAYSTEVYGYVATQTPAAAEHVTKIKVQGWLDKGLSPRQIFLIWNQGHAGKCSAGVNKYGVKYDSCSYANKALSLLDRVSTGDLDVALKKE